MDIVATIQNSIEIAGKLRALAKKIEDADFKMLVADLSNELAEAKLEVANLKGELAEARTKLLNDLQGQLANLGAQNESLRAAMQAKQVDLDALNAQVVTLTERVAPTSASKLDEVQEKILLALTQHDELEENHLASVVRINKQLAAYHVEELRKRNFVYANYTAGSEWSGDGPQTHWSIQHAGREYLLRRGMLS